jgi:hypothetical protein
MKKPLLVPSLLALSLGLSSLAAGIGGCKSSGASGEDDAGGAHSASSAGGDGSGGMADAAAGADASGPAGAGKAGHAGSTGLGDGGSSNTNPLPAGALPTTTFLYVRSVTPNVDQLVSLDYATGDTGVVADLMGDGGDGWEIWGHTISPDRTRIAVASLYGPTKADNDTGLATRRIWTMAADGSDLQRLTPVFDNDGGGRTSYSIDVQDPVFSKDGQSIIFDFGSWWYEGTKLQGGSFPWLVSITGDELPEPFPTVTGCSVIDPSVNPVTGEVLLVHSVCVNAADEGIFLYPKAGSNKPIKLVDRGYGAGAVDPALEKASWLADGSAFIFVATIEVTRGDVTDTANSIFGYDVATGEIATLLVPDAGTNVRNAAIAPNADGIVYCLAHDDVYDLHVIDLTVAPPVDSAITDDGVSCSPSF